MRSDPPSLAYLMVDAAVRTALAPFARGPVELAYEGDVPGPGAWTTRGDGPRLEVTVRDHHRRTVHVSVRDGGDVPLEFVIDGEHVGATFRLGRARVWADQPDESVMAWVRLLADYVALTKPKLGATLSFDPLPPPGTSPRTSNGPRMLVA